MPLADDPGRPDGRVLLGADGTPLARFVRGERAGAPLADFFEILPGAHPAAVLPAVLEALGGWRVSGDPEFAAALEAAGGRPGRHVHVYSRRLDGPPLPPPAPLPAGLSLTPADRPAADLLDAARAAFPPEHPDRVTDHLADLETILSGGEGLGPLLPCSALAVDAAGVVAGAVLVTDAPGDAPEGGPWVANVFRAPGHPGTGRALLVRAMRVGAADGLAALSLVVTDGNPAEGLYRALGFERALSACSVWL
jgi:ribosomal protein S18 acetylase RimI-like enzyme